MVIGAAFTAAGGFEAGRHLGEDVDFCWRKRDLGYDLLYVPYGKVAHKHRNRLAGMLRRRRQYGSSEAGLYRTHRDKRKSFLLSPYAGLSFLALALADRVWAFVEGAWLVYPLLVLTLAGRTLLSGSPAFGAGAHAAAWLGLLILAFGEGVIQPALYAGVKEYTDERTATLGYGILYSIMNLGIVAENFVSPFVRTDREFLLGAKGLGLGYDGVFWMCTVITVVMLLAHVSLFTRRVEQTDRVIVDAPKAEEPAKTWKEKLKELPFLDGRFMYFIFVLLPVRTLFAHQFLTMPSYIMRCYPPEVGAKYEWINGLNPLIIVVFVPLIAAMTRKANIVTMMIIGTSISALTTFLLVPGPNLTALLLYVTLFSLGEAVWSSRFLEYVANLAPAGKVGAYMGLAGIPWFLAKFMTGLYSGSMLEKFVPKGGPYDSSTLWLIYAVLACASPIGLIIVRKWVSAVRDAGTAKTAAVEVQPEALESILGSFVGQGLGIRNIIRRFSMIGLVAVPSPSVKTSTTLRPSSPFSRERLSSTAS